MQVNTDHHEIITGMFMLHIKFKKLLHYWAGLFEHHVCPMIRTKLFHSCKEIPKFIQGDERDDEGLLGGEKKVGEPEKEERRSWMGSGQMLLCLKTVV